MEPMTKTSHRLGWCDPGQARFWHRDEPSHRCPYKLGTIVCSCPHHEGVDPEEVNRQDRAEQKKIERARGKMTPTLPKTKKKRRRVVRKKP